MNRRSRGLLKSRRAPASGDISRKMSKETLVGWPVNSAFFRKFREAVVNRKNEGRDVRKEWNSDCDGAFMWKAY